MFKLPSKCVDVHSHIYLPRYIELLKSRQEIPRIIVNDQNENRLVILPSDDEFKNNRRIGAEYFDIRSKIEFMDKHNIAQSVISLANPWLDFLSDNRSDSVKYAALFNEDLERICEQTSGHRIAALGVLPNHNDASSQIGDCVAAIERMSASLPSIKGVIVGAHGLFGNGLDDPRCIDIYHALADHNFLMFVHPHFGVGNEFYSGYGHALHLALGFTFETTVSLSRFILSGMLDRCKDLKLMLAHCGGALPFLCGRLDYCYNYDAQMHANKLEKSPIEYIKSGQNLFFDGITFEQEALTNAISLVGDDRIMFGTDHPFFPPPDFNVDSDSFWTSTLKNQQIVQNLSCDEEVKEKIFWKNAQRIFNLQGTEIEKKLS